MNKKITYIIVFIILFVFFFFIWKIGVLNNYLPFFMTTDGWNKNEREINKIESQIVKQDDIKKFEKATFVIGENKDFKILLNEDDFNENIETAIWLLNKENNRYILIDKIKDIGQVIVFNNNEKDIIVLSMSNSSVRSLLVYDLKNQKKIIDNVCSLGEFMWKDFIIYSDCTKNNNQTILEMRSEIVENGEYAPITYKLNLRTNEKTIIASSDDLNIFIVSSNTLDNIDKVKLNKTFVKKINDWADLNNWITSDIFIPLE